MIKIVLDSPTNPEVSKLLDRHLLLMRSITPPESVYALDHEGLNEDKVSFWSAWQNSDLCGWCALKEHTSELAEIKSMHTIEKLRGQGIGDSMLEYIISISKSRGYKFICLETGIQDEFNAARKLYEKYGFEYRGPFADYTLDSNSVYMQLTLK